jgi:hypothetical protein
MRAAAAHPLSHCSGEETTKNPGVSQGTKQDNSLLRHNFLLWLPTAHLQSVAV